MGEKKKTGADWPTDPLEKQTKNHPLPTDGMTTNASPGATAMADTITSRAKLAAGKQN